MEVLITVTIKTVEVAFAEGTDYCGLVKTSHKGFFLALLETPMKDLSGGSYFTTKIVP